MVEVKPYPSQASRRPVKVHSVKAGHQPIDGILGDPKGGEGNLPHGVSSGLWSPGEKPLGLSLFSRFSFPAAFPRCRSSQQL